MTVSGVKHSQCSLPVGGPGLVTTNSRFTLEALNIQFTICGYLLVICTIASKPQTSQ